MLFRSLCRQFAAFHGTFHEDRPTATLGAREAHTAMNLRQRSAELGESARRDVCLCAAGELVLRPPHHLDAFNGLGLNAETSAEIVGQRVVVAVLGIG